MMATRLSAVLILLSTIALPGSHASNTTCYTSPNISSEFNESCHRAVGSIVPAVSVTVSVGDPQPPAASTVCPEAWNVFMSAFAGKNSSEVSISSYDTYYGVFPVAPKPNEVLFWSGTPVITDFVSSMNDRICSSFTVTASEVVNGLGVGACWCGAPGGGIDYDNPCPPDATTAFWASFSCLLGREARGVVFWLTWGERPGGAYQEGNFFGTYEFPALQPPRATRLVVFSVHRVATGEACGQGSLVTLENESKAKFGASGGYRCYDIIGDAKTTNMTEQQRLANLIVPLIRTEQAAADSESDAANVWMSSRLVVLLSVLLVFALGRCV